jgi:uncharacterized protein
MYIMSTTPVTIGIYAGKNSIGSQLAFYLLPGELPLAICSSSNKMGYSLSFGDCESATVIAKNTALAYSAATLVCNSISSETDVGQVLDTVGHIEGIRGILVVKNSEISLWGTVPQLVRNCDSQTLTKIIKDPRTGF